MVGYVSGKESARAAEGALLEACYAGEARGERLGRVDEADCG